METTLYRLGATMQGIVLGLGVLAAVLAILQIESGARVFYYQGF